MRINTLNIKDNITELNALIDSYKDLYLNMYKEFSNCSTYWTDPNAVAYFKQIELEKRKVNTAYVNLTSLRNLYQFIVDSYSSIGKIIECDLNYKESVIKSLENYNEKLSNIIKLYDSLNLNGFDDIASSIEAEREKLSSNYTASTTYLNKLKKVYSKIEQLELEIGARIAKLRVGNAVKASLK